VLAELKLSERMDKPNIQVDSRGHSSRSHLPTLHVLH
jgi:hypothetical protein